MRTTLTLDDDVVAKLRAEARRSGRPFKQPVNEFLRLGLDARRPARRRKPFKVKARPMHLRLGLDLDNIGELLEQICSVGNSNRDPRFSRMAGSDAQKKKAGIIRRSKK